MDFEIGDVLSLEHGDRGILHYFGPTKSTGKAIMFGVELLDGAMGNSDGSIGEERFFACEEKRGTFVKSAKIRKKVDYETELREW